MYLILIGILMERYGKGAVPLLFTLKASVTFFDKGSRTDGLRVLCECICFYGELTGCFQPLLRVGGS